MPYKLKNSQSTCAFTKNACYGDTFPRPPTWEGGCRALPRSPLHQRRPRVGRRPTAGREMRGPPSPAREMGRAVARWHAAAGSERRSARRFQTCAFRGHDLERKMPTCAFRGHDLKRKMPSCAGRGNDLERKMPTCAFRGHDLERKMPSCAGRSRGPERESSSCDGIASHNSGKTFPQLSQLGVFLSDTSSRSSQLAYFLSQHGGPSAQLEVFLSRHGGPLARLGLFLSDTPLGPTGRPSSVSWRHHGFPAADPGCRARLPTTRGDRPSGSCRDARSAAHQRSRARG